MAAGQGKMVGAGAFVHLDGGDIGAAARVGKAFPSGAAARFWDLLRADEHGAPYSDGSRRSPYAVQVLIDDPAVDAKSYNPIAPGAKAAGAGAERESTVGGDNRSAVLGIIAASSAVTAVATGAVGPAVAFGFFLVMLGGVVTAMAAVRGP